MPEEINRVLTDQISDRLYITEQSAAANLEREGVDPKRVVFVGNVMIDSLLSHRSQARPASAPCSTRLRPSILIAGRLRIGHAAPAGQRRQPDALRHVLSLLREVSSRCRWSSRCTRAPAQHRSASA
jgi:UDP-N-acetylglucosamine 2-epimerase (non-hydrolysing)